jgi:hypothetical protein
MQFFVQRQKSHKIFVQNAIDIKELSTISYFFVQPAQRKRSLCAGCTKSIVNLCIVCLLNCQIAQRIFFFSTIL